MSERPASTRSWAVNRKSSARALAEHREQLRWLEIMLGGIVVLNLLDVCLTLFWLESGLAAEANPLMALAVSLGPVPFALAKLALVSGGCYLLWRAREHHWAIVAIVLLFVTYYAVIVQHADALGVLAARALEHVLG